MSSEIESQAPRPIVWMTKNPVTANLIMFFFLLGGAFIILTQIRQEIFPNFERDRVRITVAYPKASPDEIEQGIILAVEEGVRGLDGIKKTTSTSREGFGIVDCELHYDVDKNKIASDIKNVVNRISSFPEDAERPIVELLTTRNEVLHFVLYGDVEENVLRTLIEAVRYDLLKEENITQIDLEGTRSLEISIEIPKNTLRIYGLTLAQVAGTIENSAIEMSGGGVKTSGGEILIRMSERRNLAEEFKNLIVLSSPEGTEIRLEDIARITETFEDVDLISSFNGKRSVTAKVYRVRDQTPIDISQTVHRYKERIDKVLPPGVRSAVRFDRSVLLHERIDLLKRNALLGLLLVFGLLGLVLEVRLAFWVTMGIPISFLGSFVFLPVVDVSINMISLFAFIVTLGMVVDDAIVIGENIYYYRQRGESAVVASIKGAWEMATPVTFSILTTLVAFSPLFFVPGEMGKVIFILPAIIITVLLLSLFESIFILPAHLAHISDSKGSGLGRYLFKAQQRIGDLVEKTADSYYAPIVRFAVRHHWATLATGIAMLIVAGGIVAGERVKIDLFPKMESDWVLVRATLPIGAPMDQNEKVRRILERAAEKEVESLSAGRD
ncbi:MAG: efflux RND transporter permease subunit, partial [Proteobacteria bacterium]|nr:efflux RND transporter permease subunit [Pseudomonadota bacterium]